MNRHFSTTPRESNHQARLKPTMQKLAVHFQMSRGLSSQLKNRRSAHAHTFVTLFSWTSETRARVVVRNDDDARATTSKRYGQNGTERKTESLFTTTRCSAKKRQKC